MSILPHGCECLKKHSNLPQNETTHCYRIGYSTQMIVNFCVTLENVWDLFVFFLMCLK